jgi:hypothetical protein
MDCPIFGGNLFKGSFFRLQAVCVKALEQWLQEDDRKSRPFRAERVREVPNTRRGSDYVGGPETMSALVEARLAYVNGLYLCTILSTLAVLERHFAGMLYAKGLESAKADEF